MKPSALALLLVTLASTNVLADTESDVLYLIDQMQTSSCTFVRNGKNHTGQEASDHLRRKWDYAKDDVTSTQVFIDEVASKSWFTGRAYQVICDEQSTSSAEWLTKQLDAKTVAIE
ncbi:DUF5329 family protein [Vibrio maritimus]|uniref:DUF5329 family protein n=1 Tax=Vibrio maritimus TaxID=990268 RepID=UPI0040684198